MTNEELGGTGKPFTLSNETWPQVRKTLLKLAKQQPEPIAVMNAYDFYIAFYGEEKGHELYMKHYVA